LIIRFFFCFFTFFLTRNKNKRGYVSCLCFMPGKKHLIIKFCVFIDLLLLPPFCFLGRLWYPLRLPFSNFPNNHSLCLVLKTFDNQLFFVYIFFVQKQTRFFKNRNDTRRPLNFAQIQNSKHHLYQF